VLFCTKALAGSGGVVLCSYGGAAVMGEKLSYIFYLHPSCVITLLLSIVGLGYGCVDLVAFPYRLINLVGYASGLVIRLV